MSATTRGRAVLLAAWMIGVAALGGCAPRVPGVTASGTVEMDEVDVASQIGGRVVQLRVDEGDRVHAGDTLALLDQGEILAGLSTQQGEAQRALAQLRDVEAGPRAPEVRAAEAELAAATAQATLAQSQFERAQALFDRNVVPAAVLDSSRAGRDVTAARRAMALRQLQLLRAGARVQQVAAARGAAQAANGQLAAAAHRAHELTLLAPISGTVLLRNVDRGEIVPAGVAVVTLGDPGRLWMRVYVPAPRLAEVRLGAPVEVHATGFGRRVFRGRVTEIASRAEFTPRAALTEEERANLVFGVKITFEPGDGALKAGLPADALILPGPAAATSR